MAKPRVFVTRRILDKGMELIFKNCDADVWQGDLPPSQAEIKKRIKGMDGLLCLLTDTIDKDVIEAAGKDLKVISNHAVGYDNIDLKSATQYGIPVGNTPGILTDATADFAFALLLSVSRRIIEANKLVQNGEWKTWSPDQLLGADIKGSTLGIIGFGRIGKAMAKRAIGFDMNIIYHDPNITEHSDEVNALPVELDTLLRTSDFISIHTPLNNQTKHLINSEAFGKMKDSAILINTARGAIIDTPALYQALKSKQIKSAALDVTDPEPLPADSPLLELDNLLICPHIASANYSTRNKMSMMAAENLIAGIKGLPLPNCVNPEVY